MITNFCVDDNGYIIEDTIPRDKDGNVVDSLHLNPVVYDYDLLVTMDRPKYNFIKKLFEDEGIEYDYYIDLMNAESEPVLKEEYRMKAYFILIISAMFYLWGCENAIQNKNNILNNLSVSSFGENSIVYIKSDGYMYKKSLIYPYTENKITTVKATISTYVKNNKLVYKTFATGYLYIKSINDIDNAAQLTTFQTNRPFYVYNNKIVFTKNDAYLYIKSIDNIDNETALTNYEVAIGCYIGNNEVVFTRLSDGFLYKINLNTSIVTQLTDYQCFFVTRMNNNEIVFSNNSDTFLYKMDLNTLVTTQLTNYQVWDICNVENNNIVYKKDGNEYLYKKSINDFNNDTQLTDYKVTSSFYIGNNEVLFYKFLDGFLYKKSINDFNNELLFVDEAITNISFCGDVSYNPSAYNTYYNTTKPEIISFIKGLNNLKLSNSSELNNYYTSTQSLREKYGIFAVKELEEIPGYKAENKIWLQQMSNILGE